MSAALRLDKIAVVVMDGVGCGELPDAADYCPPGADTLGNMARSLGGLDLPNLGAAGLGNLHDIAGVPPADAPTGCYGRMGELSHGMDTTTGHWEMMGILTSTAMPTFPDGFPPEILGPYQEAIGREVLGNKVASGTAIIEELGAEHIATGRPIVYTSADSVFQVAAHEEHFGLEELYRICEIARQQLDPIKLGRVIARPFVGEPGSLRRTYNRRDYSLLPPTPTVLDALMAGGFEVVGIGKIHDIFAGQGVGTNIHTDGNTDGIAKTIEAARALDRGLVFTNLVDFDMLYGHRNNVEGMAAALRELDASVPALIEAVGPNGAVFFTADHGNDPTTPSTDHTREWVPILGVGGGVRSGVQLGRRASFADLGRTIADNFGVREAPDGVEPVGESFLAAITR